MPKIIILFICFILNVPLLTEADSDTTYGRIRIRKKNTSSDDSESGGSSGSGDFLSSCMGNCLSDLSGDCLSGCIDGIFSGVEISPLLPVAINLIKIGSRTKKELLP